MPQQQRHSFEGEPQGTTRQLLHSNSEGLLLASSAVQQDPGTLGTQLRPPPITADSPPVPDSLGGQSDCVRASTPHLWRGRRGTPEAETSGSSEDEDERPPGQLHGQPGGCGWPPGWTGRTLPEREAAPVQEKVHGQLVSRPGPGGADFQEGPGLQTLRAAGCCLVRKHVGQLLAPAASPQSAGPSGHCPLPSALSRLLSEPQPRPLPKQLCTRGASGPAGLRSPFRGLPGAALSLSEPCLLHLHGGGVGDSAPSGGSHHG